MAELLDVSISSVRRLERSRPHPEVGPDGAHYFDPAEVTALATTLAMERRPANKPASAVPAPKLSPGELAARAFERFEQRQSLAEVVIALRIERKIARDLLHEWQISITQGELRRTGEVALPREHSIPRVEHDELERLLASLPVAEPTRISVARYVGEYEVDDASYVELVELGGFITRGPLALRELITRYGHGGFRVTACSVDVPTLRWEILVAEPLPS